MFCVRIVLFEKRSDTYLIMNAARILYNLNPNSIFHTLPVVNVIQRIGILLYGNPAPNAVFISYDPIGISYIKENGLWWLSLYLPLDHGFTELV